MYLRWPDKDPSAVKDYALDWALVLAVGETITLSEWTADTGVTIGSGEHDPFILGSVCTVWLSGGTANQTYSVRNKITTSRGLVDERTVLLRVKEQ